MDNQSAVLHFKPSFKRYASQFLSKFGKFPPVSITIVIWKDQVSFLGHTPGTSVALEASELFESIDSKKPLRFTISKDTFSTLSNVNQETACVTLKDSFISVTSGRMKLELPTEQYDDHEYRKPVDNILSEEFQQHLKYALPILKKTSSTLARSELFLECANDSFQKFHIAAVVGTKIHLISSNDECSSVYQGEGLGGISLLAPFDLLEGVQSTADANLVIDNNTLIVTESGCTSSTQTREHSLGVEFDIVLAKVREVDAGSIVFILKTERFLQMMTDLPKPPNGEYTLVFTAEADALSLMYKGKGARFSDSLRIVVKETIENKTEFSVEYTDILPVAQSLADIAPKCTVVVSPSRIIIKAKDDSGYGHWIAVSRVM